jgi:hypothetical protein
MMVSHVLTAKRNVTEAVELMQSSAVFKESLPLPQAATWMLHLHHQQQHLQHHW